MPVFEIFPENDLAVEIFSDLSTQWQHGPHGATGLNYAAIPSVFRLKGIARKDWSLLFECLRILEDEALKVMRPAVPAS